MSKGKGIYDRELSDSLPELLRAISGPPSKAIRWLSQACRRYRTPLLIASCVSLAIGCIAFISWYRSPSQPMPVIETKAPEIQSDAVEENVAPATSTSTLSPSSDISIPFPEIVTRSGLHIDLEKSQVSRSAKVFAQEMLPKLLEACPGLNGYAPDLTFNGLNDMSNPIIKEWSGIGLQFVVADQPSLIPSRFMARGHVCEYRITPDRQTLIIQKTVCASVCFQREIERTGRDLRYPL